MDLVNIGIESNFWYNYKMKKLLIFSLICIVCSCGTRKPTGKTAAENLYRDALDFKKSGRFLLALEKINALKSQYPYSYFATPAELLQADIFFEQENYTEAAAAYILFRDFHPKHKQIEYVLFKISDSFYNQLPSTFDRDLAPTLEVIRYSSELLRKFPNSKYVAKAKENIEKCEEMLRKKDQYIADFYYKTGVFDSASYRYQNILETYGEDQTLRQHAILRLVKSSRKQGKFSECISFSKKYETEVKEKDQKQLREIRTDCESDYNDLLKNQEQKKS